MKPKILAALALLAVCSSAFAIDKHKEPTRYATKELIIEGKFQKIVVDRYINLVLVADDKKNSVTVSGNQNFVDLIDIKVDKDEMIISSKKNPANKNITVYVPVKYLSYIELKHGASVSGRGKLQFNNLTVFVNTGSSLDLTNIGNIEVKSADDCEVVYVKNEITKRAYN